MIQVSCSCDNAASNGLNEPRRPGDESSLCNSNTGTAVLLLYCTVPFEGGGEMGPAARFGVEGAEAFDTAGCPVRLGGAALNFGSTDVCCVGTILLAEADGRGGGVRERPESSSGTDVRGRLWSPLPTRLEKQPLSPLPWMRLLRPILPHKHRVWMARPLLTLPLEEAAAAPAIPTVTTYRQRSIQKKT